MTFEQTSRTGEVSKGITGDQIVRYFIEHDDQTNLATCVQIVRAFEAGQHPHAAIEHDDGTVWRPDYD